MLNQLQKSSANGKRPGGPMAKNNAFTLIELLVVIAIIALLAAILFPVFGRARENARRSSCQSNFKQIALGVKQYTQDYDEKFPTANTGIGSPGPYGWVDEIQPYLKSVQIFQCPSEENGPAAVPPAPGASWGNAGHTDYYINANLSNTGTPNVVDYTKGGVSEAAVQFQSLTIMLADGAGNQNVRYRSNGCASSSSSLPITEPAFGGTCVSGPVTVSNAVLFQNHLEGTNIAFVDGHVKWFKIATSGARGRVYTPRTPFSVSEGSPTFTLSDAYATS